MAARYWTALFLLAQTGCIQDHPSALARAAAYLWQQQADDGGWHSHTYGLLRSGQSLTPFVLGTLLDVPERPTRRRERESDGPSRLSGSIRDPLTPAEGMAVVIEYTATRSIDGALGMNNPENSGLPQLRDCSCGGGALPGTSRGAGRTGAAPGGVFARPTIHGAERLGSPGPGIRRMGHGWRTAHKASHRARGPIHNAACPRRVPRRRNTGLRPRFRVRARVRGALPELRSAAAAS
jgi:hypothetical protein